MIVPSRVLQGAALQDLHADKRVTYVSADIAGVHKHLMTLGVVVLPLPLRPSQCAAAFHEPGPVHSTYTT